MKKNVAILLILLLFCSGVKSQYKISTQELIGELSSLQSQFRKPEGLGFDIKYVYTNETKPGVILDSLSGTFETINDKYHYVLDSTETVLAGKYCIMLFRNDKVMYVSKTPHAELIDPLQTMDSVLSGIQNITCLEMISGKVKTIDIFFPQGLAYKRVSFAIDTMQNTLLHATYVLKTDLLIDPALMTNDEQDRNRYDPFARIEVSYFNYRKSTPGASWINEQNYFSKDTHGWKISQQYQDYKLFIATPDL